MRMLMLLQSPTPTPVPISLRQVINMNFSSFETLRREFIAIAAAMFGPGFVWLVKSSDGTSFKLLSTYLAGSPYPGAHYRKQSVDMNTQPAASLKGLSDADIERQMTPQNSPGVLGTQKKVAAGGILLTPILCLNTWEHVWLGDYGIDGKKAFVEAWWERINWNVVADNASISKNHFSSRR